MSERMKNAYRVFWHLMLTILFLVLVFRNVEPLKTLNELYSAPWYLLMFVFLISGAVWFTLAFREGRIIRKGQSELEEQVGMRETNPIVLLIFAISLLIVSLFNLFFGTIPVAGGLVTGAVILIMLSLYSLISTQRRHSENTA